MCSLTALQKVLVSEYEPDESYVESDDESKNTSYEMLVTTVKMIKGQIFQKIANTSFPRKRKHRASTPAVSSRTDWF
jgi:hypothetical protein